MLFPKHFIDDLKNRADLVRRVCFAGAFVFAFAFRNAAQEPPKALLVDEFGRTVCEHLLASTDSLAAELKNEPNVTAYILIYPTTASSAFARGQRDLISSTLQLRGLAQDRFSFYKAKPSSDEEIRIQFWKVPSGAKPRHSDAELWPDERLNTSRAFVFGYADEVEICPTFVPKQFAKLILENPGSRGNVVVNVGRHPMGNRFYFARGWIDELVERQGVPRKRLRLFFVKGEEPTSVEFWFVPGSKK